jgi:hypothetical protein
MAPLPPTNTENRAELPKLVNDIVESLRRAGVGLDYVRWRFDKVFSDGTGFYFTTSAFRELMNQAETSQQMEANTESWPAFDHQADSIRSRKGFIQKSPVNPVAIDFSYGIPSSGRAYYVSAPSFHIGQSSQRAQISRARQNPVYEDIRNRLLLCMPPIDLDTHVARIDSIGTTTLDGVSFTALDYKKLQVALNTAQNGAGSAFFTRVKLEDRGHWPLEASFGATDGVGYREVAHMKLSGGDLGSAGGLDSRGARDWKRSAGRFGGAITPQAMPGPNTVPDLSSLHCAVSSGVCNIHVDEVGFMLRDAQGSLVLDPDFLQHIVNELVLKTFGKAILPQLVLDHVNIELPSSMNGYNRYGVSIDGYKSQNLRATASFTCGITGQTDCTFTVGIGGRFK